MAAQYHFISVVTRGYCRSVCCWHFFSTDLKSGKLQQHGNDSGVGDGPVIPLLMQNKPPVDYDENRLLDVEIRPDQVSGKAIAIRL